MQTLQCPRWMYTPPQPYGDRKNRTRDRCGGSNKPKLWECDQYSAKQNCDQSRGSRASIHPNLRAVKLGAARRSEFGGVDASGPIHQIDRLNNDSAKKAQRQKRQNGISLQCVITDQESRRNCSRQCQQRQSLLRAVSVFRMENSLN